MANFEPIPVIRGVYLARIMDVLRPSRRSCEAYLRQFGLPRALPDGLDAYVPLKAILSFSRWAAAATGIEDLGFRAGSLVKIADFQRELRESLLNASTLQGALLRFCDMAEREQAPVRHRIRRGRDDVWICSTSREGACQLDSDMCAEWLRIMPVLTIIRHFAGQDWTPVAITLQSKCAPGKAVRRVFHRTELLTGSQATGIAFPAPLIRRERHGTRQRTPTDDTLRRRASARGRSIWDFPGSLRALLRAHLDKGSPSVELAAEISCTSVRTLQRRLREHGMSYKDLIAQTRFEAAKQLLRDDGNKLADIAYTAGYSDPTNFSRAFRRMAGVSPQKYRALSHAP